MSARPWDVVVIGGGHAGCEAALAAARLGCRTLLISQQLNQLACMPCNPSIGGLAKSHLVFELDALGGEMGRNADWTGLQYRVLNRSRGPAVWANRVQCDREAYSRRMQAVVAHCANLTTLEDEVTAICVGTGSRVDGVRTSTNGALACGTAVVTAGTALRGRTFIGKTATPSGGGGRPAAEQLSPGLEALGLTLRRLKTGTPPRILAHSVDWSRTELQPGETPVPLFSWDARRALFHVEQEVACAETVDRMFHVEPSADPLHPWLPGSVALPCHLTHTNARTHAVIRENLGLSALYGGAIHGTGVRYCPSIEDKIVKFPDRGQHHVFLEPETRRGDSIYPNGLSNSLPEDVQRAMVRSVRGLEDAEIAAWGYAIEYDCIDARALDHRLAYRGVGGLYCAGQINGTTGYEEAAAQGFVAGVNAALEVAGKGGFTLSRQDAYIAVMIDDLVTQGTDEPYRMFTSRAERRLILRQENARYRLLEAAERLGLAEEVQREESRRFASAIEKEITRLDRERDGDGVPLARILSRPGVRYEDVAAPANALPAEVETEVETEIKYRGYIAHEHRAAERARRDEALKLPAEIDYHAIGALRYESREKLSRVRPEDLGQAARIPGVNPADVAILAVLLKRGELPRL